jgi:hypothetical protein
MPKRNFVVVQNITVDREDAYTIADIRSGSKTMRGCSDCLELTSNFHLGTSTAPKRTVPNEKRRIENAFEIAARFHGRGGAGAAAAMLKVTSNKMRLNPYWSLPYFDPYSGISWVQLHIFWKGIQLDVYLIIFGPLMDASFGPQADNMRSCIEEWVCDYGVAFPTVSESFPRGFMHKLGHKNSGGKEHKTDLDKKHWAAFTRVVRCALAGVFQTGVILEIIGRLTEWFSVAKLDVHTDDSITLCKDVLWPEYCDLSNSQLGGYDASSFNKDKHHCPTHIDKVKLHCCLDGMSDEQSERAHIENCKENFRFQNNHQQRMTQRLLANNLQNHDTVRALDELEEHRLIQESLRGGNITIGSLAQRRSYGGAEAARLYFERSTATFPTCFRQGGLFFGADNVFKHFERDLKEFLTDYPSTMDYGWVPMGNLHNLDSDQLRVASGMHIAKPAEPDYKVGCAKRVLAKYNKNGLLSVKQCHHVVVQDDDGYKWAATIVLLFSCVYLDATIDCAYVQYLKPIPQAEQDQQQLTFKCYRTWNERWGRSALRPWLVVVK